MTMKKLYTASLLVGALALGTGCSQYQPTVTTPVGNLAASGCTNKGIHAILENVAIVDGSPSKEGVLVEQDGNRINVKWKERGLIDKSVLMFKATSYESALAETMRLDEANQTIKMLEGECVGYNLLEADKMYTLDEKGNTRRFQFPFNED